MPAEEPAVERGLTPQAGPGCSRPRQCVERGVLAEGEQEKAEGGREKCEQEPLLRFLWDGLDKAV